MGKPKSINRISDEQLSILRAVFEREKAGLIRTLEKDIADWTARIDANPHNGRARADRALAREELAEIHALTPTFKFCPICMGGVFVGGDSRCDDGHGEIEMIEITLEGVTPAKLPAEKKPFKMQTSAA